MSFGLDRSPEVKEQRRANDGIYAVLDRGEHNDDDSAKENDDLITF